MRKKSKLVNWILLSGLLVVPIGVFAETTSSKQKTSVSQQTGSVKGVVNDDAGPIAGASVVIKGTTTGTISDMEGRFTLDGVKNGDIIQFSYIGYVTQEVRYTGQASLRVTMTEEHKSLDEVVVIGYGVKQTRGKLVNSVSKVTEETLSVGSYGDPAQALVGAVSGVKVKQTSGYAGSTPSITLRGGTTYGGSGEPLVIVDGQVRTDGLSDLNPNDIESMDVLKDAGATALYGARAANGVILVTTKSGKKGKANVNFNMKVGAQYYKSPYEMMDAYGYIYWLRKAYANTPWASTSNLTSTANPVGIGSTELNKGSVWNILRYTGSDYQQNLLNNHGWKVMDDSVSDEKILYKESNIQDYNVQSPAISQEYNLSFSGGNDRGQYYAGLGYYDAEGLAYGTFYTRYSFAFNGSYKITDWLESNSVFNYNRANWLSSPPRSSGDGYMFGRLESLPPTVRLWDEDGNAKLGNSTADGNFQYEFDKFHRDNQSDKFNMTQSLEATLFKGLKLKGTMAWSYSESLLESFNKDYHTNQAETGVNSARNSSNSFSRYFNQTYNLVASYDGQFGDHNVNAMLGMEYWDKDYKYMYAFGDKAPTDDFQKLDYTTTEEGHRKVSSSHSKERIFSYFGRAQYDWKGRYIAAFTFREDAYSRLINNRWGFFPGISAGWVMSEEPFYQPLSGIVNYAKLRGSFGQNGSIDGDYIGIYTLHGAYSSAKYNDNVGYKLTTLPNPDLRWEKTRTAEIGLDLGFQNNKYTLGFTFYDRVTSDKFASLTLPPTSGWSSVTNNNGKFRNRGIEIDIFANLLRKGDFSWTLSANISYNKNTVVQLPDNELDRNRQGVLKSIREMEVRPTSWAACKKARHRMM